MKPDSDFSHSSFSHDEEPQPGAWEAVVEGLVVCAVIIACAVAIALSGCGGSTVEDEAKSTQPITCEQDRRLCV
jgi:uncharacterized protein (DUF2062 family)